MKTLFLKNMMPFAVVAMGISGAFVTTSMQSDSKINAPKLGFTLNGAGACNIQVNCNTTPNPICRLNGDSGPQAFGKNAQGVCNEVLFKP
jgi:hypothetical protein